MWSCEVQKICSTAVSKIHRKSRILGLFYAGLCMGSYYCWRITDSQEYFNMYRDTFQNKTKQTTIKLHPDLLLMFP